MVSDSSLEGAGGCFFTQTPLQLPERGEFALKEVGR
jgi:hypothetical protein